MPGTVPVVRSFPAPRQYMCGLTWDGELLWHSDQGAGKIFAIDLATETVVREFDCPDVRADLAFRRGRLCQVGGRPKRILLIDRDTGDVVGRKAVRPSNGRLCGIENGPEGMWMCLRAPAVVQLREFATMTVQREIPVAGSPSGLTYVDTVVLYTEFDTGLLRAVDTSTGAIIAQTPVEGHPVGMTWDGEHVWYNDFQARRFKALNLADILGAGIAPEPGGADQPRSLPA
jgi:hypothetical protein